MMQRHNYFAYGSNLCPQQMENRCPGAIAIGPAVLPDHRLTFPRHSIVWNAGSADVVAAEGLSVEGALYELTQNHIDLLDAYEGVGGGNHDRQAIAVETSNGSTIAQVYIANAQDGAPFTPSNKYLATMIRGAVAHGVHTS